MDRAVKEFKIQTRGLEKAAKSASNQEWHGGVYECFRDDFLDAVPPEVVQRGGNKSVL